MTPSPPLPLLTLADVVLALEGATDLPPDRRRDLLSACRRIAALLQTTPEHLPASLAELRPRLSRVLPAAHGLSSKTWQNLRSNLIAAIKRTVPSGTPRRPQAAAGWQRLRGLLSDKRLQNGLSRFIGFCRREGVAPDQVTDAVADSFARHLSEGTLVSKPEVVHRCACRLWNEASALPDWPQIRLTVPPCRKPGTTGSLTTALPQSFHQDLEQHLDWLAGRDRFAELPPPTACRPRTIAERRKLMLLAASALIAGGRPPEQIGRLADLTTPDRVKAVLQHYLAKNGGTITPIARGLATALIGVAKDWVRVTPELLAQLKELRRRLGRSPTGLTSKNRNTLRELSDPAARQRLFTLPQRLIEQATASARNPKRAAVSAQLGLAIDILLHAPIRMNNLVDLRLDRNLVRPGGRRGLWHLVLSGEQVKNGEPLEYELPPDTTRLLDLYLTQFRSLLDPGDSQFLFVVRGGQQKHQYTLSQQLKQLFEKHVGVHITPHQFRHFAAKLMLEHSPGAFAATSQLLGHRNLQTTLKFYTGIDTLTAGRHFDRILAAERARTLPAASRGRGARQAAANQGGRP